MTGSLPSIGLLAYSNLEVLWLDRNGISGSLPTQLGALINLSQLDLGRNQLRGRIPQIVASLPNLKDLDLHKNLFSGTIPSFANTLIERINLVSICRYRVRASSA